MHSGDLQFTDVWGEDASLMGTYFDASMVGIPIRRVVTIFNESNQIFHFDPQTLQLPPGFSIVELSASEIMVCDEAWITLEMSADAVGSFSGMLQLSDAVDPTWTYSIPLQGDVWESVTENTSPELIAAPGPLTIEEDGVAGGLDLAALFTDGEGTDPAELTYTIVGNTNQEVVWTEVTGSWLSYGTNLDQFGSTQLLVRATDALGASTETQLLITAQAINDAPQPALPITDIYLDDSQTEAYLDLTQLFSDTDLNTWGEFLSYEVVSVAFPQPEGEGSSGGTQPLATAEVMGSQLKLTYTGGAIAPATVTIKATDMAGASTNLTFNVKPSSALPSGSQTATATAPAASLSNGALLTNTSLASYSTSYTGPTAAAAASSVINLPTVSIGSAAAMEGTTTSNTLSFPVSVVGSGFVTVSYIVTYGSALPGSDYVQPTTNVLMIPGDTTGSIQVSTIPDGVYEANETFSVTLTSVANGKLGTNTGIGTIYNDDMQPPPPSATVTVTAPDASASEAGPDKGQFTFTRTGSTATSLTVSFMLGGTAMQGSDYSSLGTAVTIPAGTASKTIDVTPIDDCQPESEKSVTVTLPPSGSGWTAGSPNSATVNIADNDSSSGLPTISIEDVSVTEGNSGTTNANFKVNLSAAACGSSISVSYYTSDGSATAGSDYTTASGMVAFSTGQLSQQISVPVKGDTIDENNETFYVSLSSAMGATITDNQATGTIIDDDDGGSGSGGNLPVLSVSGPAPVMEGNEGEQEVTFTITASPAPTSTLVVNYTTIDDTATVANNDYVKPYTGTIGSVTFSANQTSQTVKVKIKGDTNVEPEEKFFLELSAPGSTSTLDNLHKKAEAVILNDDGMGAWMAGSFCMKDTTGMLNAVAPVWSARVMAWVIARWMAARFCRAAIPACRT